MRWRSSRQPPRLHVSAGLRLNITRERHGEFRNAPVCVVPNSDVVGQLILLLSLKTTGDSAFCQGVNRFVVHRYALQPWRDSRRWAFQEFSRRRGATVIRFGGHSGGIMRTSSKGILAANSEPVKLLRPAHDAAATLAILGCKNRQGRARARPCHRSTAA